MRNLIIPLFLLKSFAFLVIAVNNCRLNVDDTSCNCSYDNSTLPIKYSIKCYNPGYEPSLKKYIIKIEPIDPFDTHIIESVRIENMVSMVDLIKLSSIIPSFTNIIYSSKIDDS